jgi:hypothetical protein
MSYEDKQQYWATSPANEIADRILDKVDKYYKYLAQSGRLDLYRRTWSYYYRPRLTGGMINPVGQQGELSALSINNFRNLLLHLETMTLSQRANFEPRAANSDVESQSQVILGAGLLDYYMREKRLERYIKQAVKDGLMFADAFTVADWNANGGNTYGKTASGATVYEGDIKYKNYNPLNMIRDYTKTSPRDEDWYIPRDFENKYDLAAQFPDLRDKILDSSIDALESARTTVLGYFELEDSDQVAVYTLRHAPTPAIPQGRYTRVLDNGTVLLDGPLPYDETHCYRLAPDEESGTIFGYTVAFDLLAVQEAHDIVVSTAITNISTFGVQNILLPKGHDLQTSQIAGGLNIMEYDPKVGKPEALNLTNTAPEVYNFMGMLDRWGETISGVNSVARGNPEASLKSGAALALVQSMAVQFSMNLQQSYAELIEDIGSGTIYLLQDFAAVPRVAAIAGKSNRPLMKEFSGKDLQKIHRVTVDMGNPLTRTTAGKVNLADALLEKGMIENPDQYIQVITTGRLEPVIEGKQANLLNMKSENEKLSDGIQPRAVITDDHAKHILEHSTVMASPEVREQPNGPIMVATLAHIQEHLNLAQSPGYALLAPMLGHEMKVPTQQPGLPPGGEAQMLNGTSPVQQEAQGVNQPNMPQPPQGTDPRTADIIQGQAGNAIQ